MRVRASRRLSCFNTQPPEGGWCGFSVSETFDTVSTHSRPKAAGNPESSVDVLVRMFQHTAARRRLGQLPPRHLPIGGFNTQPPEGGWVRAYYTDKATGQFQHTAARRRLADTSNASAISNKFQHTAARRRLAQPPLGLVSITVVSTHSRPKAAGTASDNIKDLIDVSTHSRPKAAGTARRLSLFVRNRFNTQPPEGGWLPHGRRCGSTNCFNTQPPEGGWVALPYYAKREPMFQHTAARRRLGDISGRPAARRIVSTHSRPKAAGGNGLPFAQGVVVSTHSRPKAAGAVTGGCRNGSNGFNTQPPEGGWVVFAWLAAQPNAVSTHSRPKAAGYG